MLGKKNTVIGGDKIHAPLENIPEYLRPREYGKKEYLPVELNSTIRVSQQRGTHNPAFNSIKESIKNGDIINSPDIAYLKRDSLKSYLAFINKVWGDTHHIDQYHADAEGYYHLVIAGHTRVEAMIELEDERLKQAAVEGFDVSVLPPATIHSKIYRDLEPEDILALQMDENLHEKPSQERTALAMVETYLYGLEVGKWRTKKEFIEANERKFSQDSLNKALVFAELDQTTRDYVFTGAVKYGPVVELAKTVKAHRRYIRMRYFEARSVEDLSPEELDEIEVEIKQWNAAEIAYLQKRKLTVQKCKDRFEKYRKEWEEFTPGQGSQDSLFLVDPTREWRDARAHTRNTLRQRVREIAALPLSGAFQALQLHVQVMDPNSDEGKEMLTILESGVRQFEGKLTKVVSTVGSTAVSAS